jgi:chromosome segregation ATPase
MEEGGRRVVDELNRRMAESVDKLNWQYQQDFAFMTGRPWPRNVGSVVSLDKPFLDTPFCVATDQRMAAQTAEGSAVAEGSAAQLVVQSHSEKKARVAVQSSLGKRASPEADLERQRDQAQRERDLAVFQCTVKEKQRDLAQKQCTVKEKQRDLALEQCTAVKKELDLARDKLKHTQEELKDAHALVARGVQASNEWRKNFNDMQQLLKEAQQERDELQKSLLQMRGRNLFDLPDAQLEGLLEDIMVAKERVQKMQVRRQAEARVLAKHPDYACPISLALMRDPVVTDDGQSYEREEIEAWFKKLREAKEPITSPLRAPLKLAQRGSHALLRL